MADNKSGSSTGLGLIVGGLVVVVAILAYFVFTGRAPVPVPDTANPATTAPATTAPATTDAASSSAATSSATTTTP